MAPEAQTGERYATQVGELWSGLAQTLSRLESLAAEPGRLDEDESVEALRRLQYRLHSASEYTLSMSPPAASAPAHGELAAALTGARDATGEVVGAIEALGAHAVDTLLHEWRGALFRVRLARLRLTGSRKTAEPVRDEYPKLAAPLLASGLTIGGAAAFAVGATVGPWPVWVAGMIAICVSLLFYRP